MRQELLVYYFEPKFLEEMRLVCQSEDMLQPQFDGIIHQSFHDQRPEPAPLRVRTDRQRAKLGKIVPCYV